MGGSVPMGHFLNECDLLVGPPELNGALSEGVSVRTFQGWSVRTLLVRLPGRPKLALQWSRIRGRKWSGYAGKLRSTVSDTRPYATPLKALPIMPVKAVEKEGAARGNIGREPELRLVVHM